MPTLATLTKHKSRFFFFFIHGQQAQWKYTPTLLIITEMQIPTMRYHLRPIKKSMPKKCWRGCGENGTLPHCWWEFKLGQPLWGTVRKFSFFFFLIKNRVTIRPSNPTSGHVSREKHISKNTGSQTFVATLLQ